MGQPRPVAGQEPLTIEVRGRRLVLTPATTTIVFCAVLLVLVIVGLTLNELDHQLKISNLGPGVATILTYAGVGVVVVRHQPRNPVGWILILFTVLTMLAVDAGSYAVFCYRLGHPGLPLAPAALVLVSLWAPAYALVALAILLFPDGRLTSRRWRWVLWIYAGLVACVTVVITAPAIAAVGAGHDIRVDSSGDVTNTGQLTGWLAHPPRWLIASVLLSIMGIWLSFVAHQVLSWRQATGEHRQQLKWLAAGATVTIGIGLIASAASTGILQHVLDVGVAALPVSMAVGSSSTGCTRSTGSSAAPWPTRSSPVC
jgi:two-component system, NarL family, sensor kinase